MKKIVVALILLALLLLNLPKPLEQEVAKKDSVVTFHYYQKQEGSVFEGTTYRLTVSGENAASIRKNTYGIVGVSVRFEACKNDVQQWLKTLNATSVRREDAADAVVYTGHSSRLTGGVMTSNGNVNFQIAYFDGFITIGSPLILGSF